MPGYDPLWGLWRRSFMSLRKVLPGVFGVVMAVAGVASGQGMKVEHFDRDPGWEGVRNRTMPAEAPVMVQDFGYSSTNVAGKGMGEMGGDVCRSVTPTYY